MTDCPNRGVSCIYLTQLDKVATLADIESFTGNERESALYSTVANKVHESMEAPKKGPCDGSYCAALGHAMVGAVLFEAYITYNAKISTERQTGTVIENPPK